MKTTILAVSADSPNSDSIQRAAHVLSVGGLVAFPTETVYGLGADALNPKAVEGVFRAKGRPSDNPLIVHLSDLSLSNKFVKDIPPRGKSLAERFWPGPLTLVLPRSQNVPDQVTAGLDTVAIRIPDHPVALAMLRTFGSGVVAPSANLSGRPSPTTADHVFHDLADRIELILDAGPTRIGIESTVVDVTVDPPVILRYGGLAREQIEQAIGKTQGTQSKDQLRRSPGTRYRHYAPVAKLVLVQSGDSKGLRQVLENLGTQKKNVGVITHSITGEGGGEVRHWKKLEGNSLGFARDFFSALRELDDSGVDVIVVEGLEENGLGIAVMERLRKAMAAE